MNYDLTGTLFEKFDTVQRTATFKVREFVVEHVKDLNGKAIVNHIKFQCTQDKTDLIDKFNRGDKVKVHFNIRGSKWEKNGQVSYFNNLEAWRVEQVLGAETQDTQSADPEGPDFYSDTTFESNDDLPF